MKNDYSPQQRIENFMAEVIKLGNYETAYLLSEEGLALAHDMADEIVPEERLVEMAVLFQEIQKMADVMGGISDIKELVVEGSADDYKAPVSKVKKEPSRLNLNTIRSEKKKYY